MKSEYLTINSNKEVIIDINYTGNLDIKGLEPGKVNNILLNTTDFLKIEKINDNHYTVTTEKNHADDYICLYLPTDEKYIINIENDMILRQVRIENAKGLTLRNISSEETTGVICNSEIDYINLNNNIKSIVINDSKIKKLVSISSAIWINSSSLEHIFLKKDENKKSYGLTFLNVEDSNISKIEAYDLFLSSTNSSIENIKYDFGDITVKDSNIENIESNNGNAILVNSTFKNIINNKEGKVKVNKDGLYIIKKKLFKNYLISKNNKERPKVKAKIIKYR